MSKRARKHRHATQSIPPQGLTLATAALLGLLVTPALAENKGESEDNATVRGTPTNIFRGKVEDKYAVVVEDTLMKGDPPTLDPRTIIGRYEDENSTDVATGGSATIGTAGGANVPDVQTGEIYGGYQGKDQAATSNTVTIYSGTGIKDVYGGYAHGGNVSDNTVDMRGGTVAGSVYGGQVYAALADKNAATNTVTISGGTVGGDVYGGHNGSTTNDDASPAASGNAVVVNGTDSAVTITGHVYGNYAKSGSIDGGGKTNVQLGPDVTVEKNVYGGLLGEGKGEATGHAVHIDGAHITGNVFGGRHNKGSTVSGNTVTVSSGEVTGKVYGGFSGTGVATQNTVTLTKGTVTNSIYGGYAKDGNATKNEATLSGGTVTANVYGGYADNNGAATQNAVTFSEGTVTKAIYGGYAKANEATGNTVNLTGGTVTENVYGGYTDNNGAATQNAATLTKGTVAKAIYGGHARADEATGNTVNLTGGTVTENVYGGYAGIGAAMENTVTFSGGTVNQDVYGGYTDNGAAKENAVTFSGGTVTANVYGGYTKFGGNATDNTVTFSGGMVADVNKAIYGGYAKLGAATGNTVNLTGGTAPENVYANYADNGASATTGGTVKLSANAATTTLWGGNVGTDVTGNTLIVQAKGLEAKAAKNFEKYTFALPSDFTADETMLTLLDQGGNLTIDAANGDNITVSGGGSLALNLGEKATLLSVGKGYTLTVDNLPATAMQARLDGEATGLTTLAYTYENPIVDNKLNIIAGEKYLYGDGGPNNNPGQRESDNTLEVTGGTATAAFGGRATNGDVTNNTATMSDGTLVALNDPTNPNDALSGNLYGGYADNGDATGNAATLSGGTVEKAIYGGYAATGNATGNTAAVTGGTVNQDVYGGHAAGDATGNTVDYSGGTVSGILYGGRSVGGGDEVSGNTLIVRRAGLRAGNTANFERYWFVLPSNTVANATMLTVTDGNPTDLTNGGTTTPKVGVALLKGAGDPALRPGDRVTLLHNAAGVKSDGFVDDSAALKQRVRGTFVDYDFELAADSNNLYASVTGAGANAKAKAPVEARMGMTALVNMGGELVAGRGMQAARTATRRRERAENPETYGLTGFATVEGNSSRYETGSHIDVSGVNTLLGLAKRFHSGDVDVLLGAFFEYGTGYVHTHNAGGIDGQGNNSYAGGGLLGRVEMNDANGGTTYGEASLRMGGTRSSWDSKDIVPGGSASYELNTPYYGAHAGLGYVWSPSDRLSVETYGKYYWTHVDGDSVNIAGTRFKFKDVESHRVRAGVKADFKVNEQFGFYVGAAWEHEFNGKGEAVVSHLFDAPSPSLQGDIGVFDLGVSFTPAENFFISLGATGYVGKRQGIGGNLMFRYEF